MLVRNTTRRWGAVAQLLHWLIVALVIVQFTLAALADDLPPGVKKLALLARHKSFGLTILALAALRLAWRFANPTPDLPPTLRSYERKLARVTHGLLYLLLFAMPLTGWMMSSARGFPGSWFGFFQLPDLLPRSGPLYQAFLTTHGSLGAGLVGGGALHDAAALKQPFLPP